MRIWRSTTPFPPPLLRGETPRLGSSYKTLLHATAHHCTRRAQASIPGPPPRRRPAMVMVTAAQAVAMGAARCRAAAAAAANCAPPAQSGGAAAAEQRRPPRAKVRPAPPQRLVVTCSSARMRAHSPTHAPRTRVAPALPRLRARARAAATPSRAPDAPPPAAAPCPSGFHQRACSGPGQLREGGSGARRRLGRAARHQGACQVAGRAREEAQARTPRGAARAPAATARRRAARGVLLG